MVNVTALLYFAPTMDKILLRWAYKKTMKHFKLLILIYFLIGCKNQSEKTILINPEIKQYVDFLQTQNTTAKEYVLSLYDKYEIVVLSERKHYEYSQYKIILDVISDKKFIDSVRNIFVEVGVSTEQNKIDEFLNSENLSEKEIEKKALEIYRNIPFLASWDKTSYYDFLIKLYKINQNLEPDKKIKLFYSDIPFSWKKTKTQYDYKKFLDTIDTRDSIIATQIISNFDKIKSKRKKKALVILNYRHGFLNIKYNQYEKKVDNVGRYLKEKYKERIASVLINDIYADINGKYYPIQNGKWDAAFEILNKSDIGFNFQNSPFGKDSFDMYPVENELTYQDVFTGFIYTSPIDSFVFKKGVKHYISSDFEKEYIRRVEIAGYKPDIKNDTVLRIWRYSEKEWCPNYEDVRNRIDKWKHATTQHIPNGG
jgi:hypothetical protein